MARLARRIIVLLAAGGLLLALLPATAAAAPATGSDHQRILAHWTPARMAAALPRDFLRTPSGFVPAAKPAPSTMVTGATWTRGGTVLKATGKVYFEMGGGAWICSGSVIQNATTGRSLVLTAGHCAYDEANREFATNWMFIPDFMDDPTYTCSATIYGCWTAEALVVDSGFATAGGFNTQATTHDWAVAVVGNGGNAGTDLEATVGGFPIDYPALRTGDKAYAFGYPAAGRYKGDKLTYCAGPTFNDVLNANLTWGLACKMTGGSSGGPWFAGFTEATGTGTLSSLNSYGYSGIGNMYGPKFDANTRAVVTAAATVTANTIVPER